MDRSFFTTEPVDCQHANMLQTLMIEDRALPRPGESFPKKTPRLLVAVSTIRAPNNSVGACKDFESRIGFETVGAEGAREPLRKMMPRSSLACQEWLHGSRKVRGSYNGEIPRDGLDHMVLYSCV